MEKRPFTLLRVLGIIVGLLFVGIAPFIAKENHGFPSFEGIGYLIVVVATGLTFIGYGITGVPKLPKPPPRLRLLPDILVVAFYLSLGLLFLLGREGSTKNRIFGGVWLVLATISILVTYAKYRSKPAA